jgi:hypothetical protein
MAVQAHSQVVVDQALQARGTEKVC